jgi:AcrR family transcriptional regulator
MAMKSENGHDTVRKQILDAARSVFGKHGYKKTNIEDIARVCQRGQSSVYYYFKNKQDIFKAVIESEFNSLMTELREIIRSTSDPQQKLRLYLSSRMDKIKTVSNFYDTINNEYFEGVPFVEKLRKSYDREEFELISSILEEGKSRNIFHIEHTENVTQAIMSAMRGLEIPFFNKQIDIDINNRIEELLNVLFYGLLRR